MKFHFLILLSINILFMANLIKEFYNNIISFTEFPELVTRLNTIFQRQPIIFRIRKVGANYFES